MVIFSIVYPNQNYFKEYCQILFAFSTLLENYIDFITANPKVLNMASFV